MKPFVLHAACLTGAMLLATQASAQVALPPAQVDPGRVQQQLTPPEAPRTAPEIVTPEIPATVAPADAATTRITVREIRVEGSSVYPAGAFADLTAPLTGREVSLAEAFTLADAITARYRGDDYILSRAIVPAQRIENGVLRIQIVEGFVSGVEFQGKASAVLRRYADALTAEKPLRGKVLERYLLLMNDIAGTSARAVLAPAPDVRGGSFVTIVADQKTVDAYAGFDNHGSRYIGPVQYYAGVSTNNALGLGERIALNYAGAVPTSELQYVSGQIDLPLGRDGLLLSANAGYSHSRPGFVLEPLGARATGTSLGARVSYPLIRSRAATLRLSLGFHYLDSRTVINDLPDFSPSSYDRIRALRLTSSYDFADRAGGQNLIALEYSQGLSIFGSLSEARLNPSRPNAKNGFHKLTAEISRRQTLDSMVRGLAVYGVVKAQTSLGDSLFSSEQFGLGGAIIGTAYDPSEIIGDSGIAGRIELQYATALPAVKGAAQFYGFYDVGTTRNQVVQPGEARSASLSSAGGGMRFTLTRHLSGYVEAAQPLTRDVQAQLLAKKDARPTRLFVGVTMRY
ncbi:hypothetical protein LWE61_20280 [Sphingobium sufflavum]|uniref:ShlB/FhaC/HecB family hemolysin secretion/activation protein n=1 Tax=Sphingobium sufflavum TaxID=1129547 RepID=UPI001F433CF4|nr:ShlB/FhaC/HecB family hemolysin secretion/activation protein [Sphingobium sufflavum]MCE7798871.1 hypothetical protein [Sphingobium sufflavum]